MSNRIVSVAAILVTLTLGTFGCATQTDDEATVSSSDALRTATCGMILCEPGLTCVERAGGATCEPELGFTASPRITHLRQESTSAGSARIVRIRGFSEKNVLLSVQEIRRDADGTVDLTMAILDGGRWKRHVVENAQSAESIKLSGDAFDDAFRRREQEITEAKLTLGGGGTSEGPIACGLATVGATAACGGLAGIPFAGWVACGLAVSLATCECFADGC
jgi:hypothetical protein